MNLLGYFSIVMSGPATGRRRRATTLRVLLPCLALIVFDATSGQAQTLTPDMLRPGLDGFVSPLDSPLRKIADESADGTADPGDDQTIRDKDAPAPSRIGRIPSYGLPAASGASDSGYDSLNRNRKQPKFYPGQAKPKPPPGPGSPPPGESKLPLRLSIPPSESANKTPLPPATAGTVVGQPQRRRLKVDDDPFGAVGDYAGGFLIKSAVEVSGGYDTNPGRLPTESKGLPFWVVAPEFLAVSDWERHALVADLRGSYTGYGGNLPATVDGAVRRRRPISTGRISTVTSTAVSMSI